MKTIKIISIILASTLLLACAESNEQTSVKRNPRTNRDGGNGTSANPQSGTWSGVIFGSPQGLFQDATEDFVSSFMNPKELGSVDGQFNQSTGIRFFAPLSTSVLSDNNINNLQISGGNLNLLIFDSFAQSGQAEAIVISTLRFKAKHAVGASYLDIHFEDEYSYVGLYGTISGEYFVGEIRFENKKSYNNGNKAKWNVWAGFQIPKCEIFRCN